MKKFKKDELNKLIIKIEEKYFNGTSLKKALSEAKKELNLNYEDC